MPHKTLTAETLEPATRPTLYFIGVTTGASSIRTVFPEWAQVLRLGEVEMVGIDLPLHAPAEQYRAVVSFIAADALSLGALVTTHKLDLFHAARDVFDEVDPLAELMDEVSSISKRDGRLRAHAKDPISSGLAIDAALGATYFATRPREVVLFGAGGSAIAIDWYLTRPERGADHPSKVTVTNRSPERLEKLRSVHERFGAETELVTVVGSRDGENDAVLASATRGTFVVNATGLGKDAPGSPLTDGARWPHDAVAWDLNYRGDLVFLDQARAAAGRGVRPVDGWTYFIHGWTQVIAEVFDVTIPSSGPEFDELSRIATSVRR